MSTQNQSPNYNFNLPGLNDVADIRELSANWETADELFHDAWYKTATIINNYSDLNDFSNIGIYIYSSGVAATLENVPEVSQGTLIVLPRLTNKNSANITQALITRENSLFVRAKYDDTWNKWTKFASMDDLTDHINDMRRHVPDTCTLTEDWNTAVKTGWYMSNGKNKNAPGEDWYFGYVIAHNDKYVLQEAYDFTNSSEKVTDLTKYIRSCHNGTWTQWENVTIQQSVPREAKLNYIKTLTADAQQQINDLDNRKMDKYLDHLELTPKDGVDNGGYIDFHFSGDDTDYTSRIIEEAKGVIHLIAELKISKGVKIVGGSGELGGDTGVTNISSVSDIPNGKKRSLQIRNKNKENDVSNALYLTTNDESTPREYLIYGAHNKPAGTYTGNAEKNPRYINTGGVGNVLAVWSNQFKGIITPFGGFAFGDNTGTDAAYSEDEVKYVNGTLTINMSWDKTLQTHKTHAINATGYTYRYQCL